MTKFNKKTSFAPLLISSLLALILSACDSSTDVAPAQEAASLSAGTLTVVTTPSETSYFENKGEADGFEFQLIKKFAEDNNYQLKLILTDNEDEVYQSLAHGIADIAMIGHPLSLSQQKQFTRSQSLMDITTQLIYRHGTGKPVFFGDLSNKNILVQDKLQYREKYQFLKQQYPDLNWTFSNKSSDELLTLLDQGAIDYTLIDSHLYSQKQSLYPHTRAAFDLYYPEPISWVWSEQSSKEKQSSVEKFLELSAQDGTLKTLVERFYGHSDDVNHRGSMSFFRRVDDRLPRYQNLIEDIAQQYNIDWRLLAAIAYQESHWNPKATSPTGVRGMMMLTQGTAKDMGINNRLDVTQSLRGGAKYLKSMLHRLPKNIPNPDRTWFALAAYNVGLGHIKDAQFITEFHGGNPESWADVKRHLPLLEKKVWHRYTRYGFARGSEPVAYVQNIRHFSDLLEWRFPNSKQSSEIQHAAGVSVETLNPETIRAAKNKHSKPSNSKPQPRLTQALKSLFGDNKG